MSGAAIRLRCSWLTLGAGIPRSPSKPIAFAAALRSRELYDLDADPGETTQIFGALVSKGANKTSFLL